MDIQEDLLVLSNDRYLCFINISNPSDPLLIYSIDLGPIRGTVGEVTINGDLIYLGGFTYISILNISELLTGRRMYIPVYTNGTFGCGFLCGIMICAIIVLHKQKKTVIKKGY